jgi:serine/threonine-protein kinase
VDSPHADRIEELFVEALGLPPAQREQFLESACAGNLDVRHKVRVLLDAEARCAEYFDKLPGRLGVASLWAGSAAAEATGSAPRVGAVGQQYGHYTLTEFIGSGGMGSVWRAVRSDGRFEGEVAVKLLSCAADNAAAERFALEGRYLAKLTHPGIARLMDAGIGPAERPYLILEYVDGLAIDKHCDAHALHIAQRIELFLQVLDALAHAHAHLIVHRDLKPSNVRVSPDGTVKLLDFGIAKLLDPHAPFDDGLTRQLGMALTPEFAAPEQLEGAPITTATDIYSLGLLLWLLVVGANPRETQTARSLAELRALANRQPTTLAAAATADRSPEQLRSVARYRGTNPADLLKTLRSDLDSIVRKAVAIEPSDRYATAGDFAQDLRRYLRDEPVTSQVNTVRYRVRKFIQRHRGGVLAASVTGIALLAAAIVTVWQGVEAARQRDAAIHERERAQAANDFMSLLMEEVGPGGKPFTMFELLDQGLELLDAQHAARQPYTAATYYDVALRYAVLGQDTRARELLDRTQELAREEDDRDVLGASLCTSAVLEARAETEQARAHLQEALDLLDSVPEASLDAHRECAQAQARLLVVDGQWQKAIDVLSSAVQRHERSGARASHRQALLLHNISGVYYGRGIWQESLDYNARALEMLKDIGRADTMLYLLLSNNRSSLLLSVGEVRAAHELREGLLARVRQLDEPAQRPFWSTYAASLARLARYEESLAILERVNEHDVADGNESPIAQNRFLIGTNLAYMGRPSEALAHLQAAESYFRRAPAAGRRLLSSAMAIQAYAHLRSGAHETAASIVAKALDEAGYRPGSASPDLKLALRTAALIAVETRQWERAGELVANLLSMCTQSARDPALSADVGHALLLRARLRQATGEKSGAREDAQSAIPPLTAGLGEDHPETKEARALLAQLIDR